MSSVDDDVDEQIAIDENIQKRRCLMKLYMIKENYWKNVDDMDVIKPELPPSPKKSIEVLLILRRTLQLMGDPRNFMLCFMFWKDE